MNEQSVITIGGITLPLGTTAADMVDQVTTQVKLAPIRFTFDYRQVRFTCNCDDREDGTIAVKLVARLGIVPFTAESAAARSAVQTIADSARRDLNGGVSISEGYVVAQFQTSLAKPISATSIISAVAITLIRLNPYLGLLGEIIELPLAQQARKSAIRPPWRPKTSGA
jgi:hypothetical protein